MITRLHARYSRDTVGEDLMFRKAPPVEGGRNDDAAGSGAVAASSNNYQARYIIRHPWIEPVTCSDPAFGVWGGPPGGELPPPPLRMSPRVRRDVPLDTLVLATPESGVANAHEVLPRHEVPSRLRRWMARGLGFLGHDDGIWAVVGAYVLGLLLVLALGRRRGKVACAYALKLAVVAAVPALLWLWSESERSWKAIPLRHLELVVYEISACALVVVVMRLRDGRPWPLWIPAWLAMLPAASGLALYRYGLAEAKTVFAMFEPRQWPMLAAVREGESLQGVVVGACGSALLLSVAAAGATPAGSTRRPRRFMVLVAALVALPVVIALFLTLSSGMVVKPQRDGWPMLLFGLVLTASTWTGWRVANGSPDDSIEPSSPAPWASLAWLACAAGLVAVALVANIRSAGLVATDMGFDPFQTAHILDATFATARALAWRSTVAALLSLAPLLVASWLRWRERPSKLDLHAAIESLAPFAVVVGLALLYVSTQRAVDALHHAAPEQPVRFAAVDVDMPSLCEHCETRRMGNSLAGPALIVRRDGTLLAAATSSDVPAVWRDASYQQLGQADEPKARPEPLLLGDRDLTVQRLAGALHPILSRQQPWFRWVLGAVSHARPAGDLGRYGDLLQDVDVERTLDVEWVSELGRAEPAVEHTPVSAVALRLHDGVVDVLELAGAHGRYRTIADAKRTAVPLSDLSNHLPYGLGTLVSEVVLRLSPQMTLSTVAELMQSTLEPPHEFRGATEGPAPRFVITTDDVLFR